MLYDHAETLRTVAPEDIAHVQNMLARLDAHARTGVPVGSFLTALLDNAPLLAVVSTADDINIKYLREFAKYVYNHLPATVRGRD